MNRNERTTEDVVGGYLRRLADHDADAIAGLFADSIDWYVGGNAALPWTGARSHRSQVAEYFRTMWPHFVPGESTSTLQKLVISGDEAVVFAVFTHKAVSTGTTFQTPVAMHDTVNGGKIVAMHLYEDTWAVSNAFFSQVRSSQLG